MLFILFAASAFRKLSSIYVFSYFPFGFEGRIWDLIVSVPDHCLSFYFESLRKAVREEEKEMTLTRGIQHQVLNSTDARTTEEMNERMKVLLGELESLHQEMNEMKEKKSEKRGYCQYYGRRNRQYQNQEAERAQRYEDQTAKKSGNF